MPVSALSSRAARDCLAAQRRENALLAGIRRGTCCRARPASVDPVRNPVLVSFSMRSECMALVPSSVFSFLRSSAAPAPETPGNDGQRRTGSPEPAHSRPPSPAGTHRARASSLASSLRRSLSGSSESVGSFEEVVPLLQEHGGYVNVNPNSPEIQAALEESRTISQQVKDAVYGYCRWL